MPSPALEHMSRAQVQALCKERGIKANAKTSVLIEHLRAQQQPAPSAHPPRAASKAFPPKAVVKKASVVSRRNDELELDSASSEDDEMMLGPGPAPVPVRSAAQPALAAKKLSSSSSGSISGPVRKRVASSSSNGAPTSSAAVVYQTSPNTKETISTLVASVKALQTELASAKSALSTLQRTSAQRHSLLSRSPPTSARLTREQVVQIVDAKLFEHRETVHAVLGPLRARMEANDHWREMVETSLTEVRQEITAKLTGGRVSLGSQAAQEASLNYDEQSFGGSPQVELESSFAQEAQAQSTPPPAEAEASAVYSDAPPPTESLASFSSPTASPRRGSHRSSVAQAAAPLAETPRRSVRKSIVPASSNTALALPPHMVLAASPRRQSGRRSSVSPVPAGLEVIGSPKSPARSREKLAIGKRARGPSEASEVSVVAQRITAEDDAPENVDPARDISFVSQRREGHSRKRRRMSAGEALARARRISNSSEDEGETEPESLELVEEHAEAEEVLDHEERSLVADEEEQDAFDGAEAEALHAPQAVKEDLTEADGAEEAEEEDGEEVGNISNGSWIEHETALDLEPEVDQPARFVDEARADLSSIDDPIPVESLVHSSRIASPAAVPVPTTSLGDPFSVDGLVAPPAAGGARKSMPAASFPFPLTASPRSSRSVASTPNGAVAAPFERRRTLSSRALLDATNAQVMSPAGAGAGSRKGSRPVTPMAAKTLYGTELVAGGDRFDDFAGDIVAGGGVSTPAAKPVWGGFF